MNIHAAEMCCRALLVLSMSLIGHATEHAWACPDFALATWRAMFGVIFRNSVQIRVGLKIVWIYFIHFRSWKCYQPIIYALRPDILWISRIFRQFQKRVLKTCLIRVSQSTPKARALVLYYQIRRARAHGTSTGRLFHNAAKSRNRACNGKKSLFWC